MKPAVSRKLQNLHKNSSFDDRRDTVVDSIWQTMTLFAPIASNLSGFNPEITGLAGFSSEI